MVILAMMALLAQGPRTAESGGALREWCAADARVLARLEPGLPVTVRSSITGENGVCYRVETGGQKGYLFAAELEGLEEYDAARRGADTAALPSELRVAAARAPPGSTVGRAVELLEARQPRQALQLFEYALAREGANGPNVLALAGLAALQSDQPAKARAYFQRSLALEANPQVAALAARAERESAHDNSDHVLRGSRFVLRYDQLSLAPAAAAAMVNALEAEYARLDAALGCDLGEQVTVVVHTPERYRAATGAAEWSAAQFDGRIRVAAPQGATVTSQLRQTFAHEIVHACLARRGSFPAWFHEGMAQRWSGDRLSGPQRAAIRGKVAAGALPPLARLGGSWSAMAPEAAALAYAYALAAVEALYETRGDAHVRELLQYPARLAQTEAELARALAP